MDQLCPRKPSGYEPVERLTGHMGVRISPRAPNDLGDPYGTDVGLAP